MYHVDTSVDFDGFVCLLAVASPEDSRTFTFAEIISADRMSPRMVFCDEFDYLGIRTTVGMMTQELPDRPQGDWPMTPVAQDRDSYYFNALRTPFVDYCDSEPVETKRVYLKAGDVYDVEHNQAVMLVSGQVNISRGAEPVVSTSPVIIDARPGRVTIEATTDAIICESWV